MGLEKPVSVSSKRISQVGGADCSPDQRVSAEMHSSRGPGSEEVRWDRKSLAAGARPRRGSSPGSTYLGQVA